jgi:hypothetical protein
MRVRPCPLEGILGFSAAGSDGTEARVVSDGSSSYCFSCRSDSCAHASAVSDRIRESDSERITAAIFRLDPDSESLSDDVDAICGTIFSEIGGSGERLRLYSRLMGECFRLESEGAFVWPDRRWEEKASLDLRSSPADAVWDAVSSEGCAWARDLIGELDPEILGELADAHPGEPAIRDVYLALGRYEEYVASGESRPEAVLESVRRLASEGKASEAPRILGMLPDISEMDAKGRNAAYEAFRIVGDAGSMRRIEMENLVREPSEYALKAAMSSGKSREELVRLVAEERLRGGADDAALSFLARNGMQEEVLSYLESRGFSLPEGSDVAKVIRAIGNSGQGACARKAAGSALETILREGRTDSYRQAASFLAFLESVSKNEPGGAKAFRQYRSRLRQDYGDRTGFWDIAGRIPL